MLDVVFAATGEPLWTDPRHLLKGVVARLEADGLFATVACEFEFFLTDGARDAMAASAPPVIRRTGRPLGPPTNLSVLALEEVARWSARLDDAARRQNVSGRRPHRRDGRRPVETNLAHQDDAVLAGDHAILLKRLVRGTARAERLGRDLHGQALCGADRFRTPRPGQPARCGRAQHLRRSCRRRSPAPPCGGGHAEADAESLAFFAPKPQFLPPLRWPLRPRQPQMGRGQPYRRPARPHRQGRRRRVEHRVAGADANPYLVLAAVLASAHHGIERKLEPDAPVIGRHAGFKRDRGFPPTSSRPRAGSLSAPVLKEYFPKRYLETYAHLIHGQHEALLSELTVREYDFFF